MFLNQEAWIGCCKQEGKILTVVQVRRAFTALCFSLSAFALPPPSLLLLLTTTQLTILFNSIDLAYSLLFNPLYCSSQVPPCSIPSESSLDSPSAQCDGTRQKPPGLR